MELQIYQDFYYPKNLEELKNLLLFRHDNKFGSFWLFNGNESLAFHINQETAFLAFFGKSDNESFRSINPNFDGSEEDTVGFVIDNFQMDEISAEFVISVADAQEAFEEYFLTCGLSKKINWK